MPYSPSHGLLGGRRSLEHLYHGHVERVVELRLVRVLVERDGEAVRHLIRREGSGGIFMVSSQGQAFIDAVNERMI